MTGQILLAWLKALALDGDLAKAEPKTLRYLVLHAATRLVRGGRRRRLKIQATWPWAEAITAAWQRIDALPQAPLPAQTIPAIQEGTAPGACGTPGHPARQPGHRHTPALKPWPQTGPADPQRQPSTRMKGQG